MIELNLIASNKEQERVKEYLQNSVSETLADKINKGVKITKDNKSLLNKKDLNGFIKFACDEARKQSEKGSNSACVEDETVFGWAIHYFEEDSIEGNLYNEDGTEYKPIVKNVTPPIQTKTITTPTNKQATLFDLFKTSNTERTKVEEEQEDNQEIEEDEPIIEDDLDEKDLNSVFEEKHNTITINNQIVDTETGEIIAENNDKTPSINKDYLKKLYTIFEGSLEVK